MKYFLGVDGGGTKTAYAIGDFSGKCLAKHVGPSCHHQQTIGFKATLSEGIEAVLSQLSLSVQDIAFALLGIPGYGEFPALMDELHGAIEAILPGVKYRCVNDVVVGWAAGCGGNPCIHLISGTGSIAYGVDPSNKAARSGGWGPFFGDEGSGFWLGQKAIELFVKQSDGRLPKDAFYSKFKAHLQLNDDFDILTALKEPLKVGRTKVASFSVFLLEAASYNLFAQKAFEAAADELSLLCVSVLKQLSFTDGDPICVSYSGGVFEAGEVLLAPLRLRLKALDSRLELHAAKYSPIQGALHLAKGSVPLTQL